MHTAEIIISHQKNACDEIRLCLNATLISINTSNRINFFYVLLFVVLSVKFYSIFAI